MPENFDVIIIGSGPAGVGSAWPPVESGLRVAMIDGGYEGPAILSEPCGNFEEMRRTHADQHRWLLGEDLSSIPVDGLHGGLGGGMASGNRSYVTEGTDTLLPLKTKNAPTIIQSLAKGGLGAAWGAACSYLEPAELTRMGLPPEEMREHYRIITERIGISGPADGRDGVQPPLRLDHHADVIRERYRRDQPWFDRRGIRVTQPHSAVLTEDRDGRAACPYNDMEYYADPGGSVYRPQFSVEALSRYPNFRYLGGHVVDRIHEENDDVRVEGARIENHKRCAPTEWHARKVICAAGAIGTARILLRSFGMVGRAVPFIAKSHALLACLHPSMLGVRGPAERSSLCQLLVTLDDDACAQLYSYRSLLLFRLLSSLPLPVPAALRLLALLTPALVIADVRFGSSAETGSTLSLVKESNGHDAVSIRIRENEELKSEQRKLLRRLRRGLSRLGLLTVRSLSFPEGSTSHYAGTVPCTSSSNAIGAYCSSTRLTVNTTPLLSVDTNGKLHQGRNIFVADSSVFRSLPSKPHTLTIMANANRVGTGVARGP